MRERAVAVGSARPFLEFFSPGGALPGSRACAVRTDVCVRTGARGGREREVEGGKGGRALARSLSSPRPRTRVWLCPPARAHGGRRLSSRSRSPPSTPAACLTAPRRLVGVSPLSRPAVPFRFWGVVRVPSPPPSGGKGSASRRRPAALSPWLPGARAGRSRRRARGRDRARRRRGVPPSRVFHPRTLSGYLATAFRRVGLKTPRGGRLFRPRGRGGGGARREPSTTSGGSRGLPFLTRRVAVPEARRRGRGFGSPLSGARGARLRVPGSPVRRRSRAPCLSVPTRSPRVSFLVSLAGPRRTPLRSPAASPGAAGGEGDCAAVSSHPKGKRSYDS